MTSETVRDGKFESQKKEETIKEHVPLTEEFEVSQKEHIVPIVVELEDDILKDLREVGKPFESKIAWSKYYNNYVNKNATKGYV